MTQGSHLQPPDVSFRNSNRSCGVIGSKVPLEDCRRLLYWKACEAVCKEISPASRLSSRALLLPGHWLTCRTV